MTDYRKVTQMKGRIHSIETLGALDGPGLRCVLFFQGCPMRCMYCHNPDMWELVGGKEVNVDEALTRILRFKPYFRRGGGITLSGGEPFMQATFATEVLKGCKEQGIHTAVDTNGYYLDSHVKEALGYTDLVILDIKHTVPIKHEQLTGQPLMKPLEFLEYVADKDIPTWVRQVVVPGWNDTATDIKSLGYLVRDLACVHRVELLPYHTMGVHKWEKKGIPYPLVGTNGMSQTSLNAMQYELDAIISG